jgi:TP901 family phage tail tape measure protein
MSKNLAINIVLSAVDEASKDIEAVNIKVKQLREELDKSEFSRTADGLTRFGAAVKAATQPMADAAKTGLAFAAAITAVTGALAGKAYQAAVSYESAMADLAKVTAGGMEEAQGYAAQLNVMADQYAQNGEQLLSAMTNFVQAGYSAADAFTLVENSLQLMIAGELEAGEASKNLISILKGFDAPASEAAHAVDLLNEVSNNYATDVKQLADGMATLSPVAQKAGFTMNETAGLLTPIIEIYQSGAEAADSLKVGLLKLADGAKPVVDALESIGISQKDANGQLKSSKAIFLEVAQAFQTLDDKTQIFIASELVGIEQAGRMSTVLGNLGKYLEITAVAANSAGSAVNEVETRLRTAQAAADRANERFRQLAVTLGNQFKTEIIGVVTATGELANALDQAAQGGALEPLLAALRPQIAAIETLFSAMADNLEAALNGLDWSPLVEAIGDLSGEFGAAFQALTDGIDLTTVEGLRTLLQGLIGILANFTRYIAGVVDGMGPLFSSLNMVFGYLSQNHGTIFRLVGEMHGLAQSINTIIPLLSQMGSAVMGAVGSIIEFTLKVGLLVVTLRLLAGTGALAFLGSLLGVLGRLSPVLVGVIAAMTGLSGTMGALLLATFGASVGVGLLLSKLVDVGTEALYAKTGIDLFGNSAQAVETENAAAMAARLAAKLKEISDETGVAVTSMKELEAAVKSGALVQDAATGAWSKGDVALKRMLAETKANEAASAFLAKRTAEQAAEVQELTDAFRAQGLVYDARTGAVSRAESASAALGAALTWEQQLAADGITVFEFLNDQLVQVTGSTLATASAQDRLSRAIHAAAQTDAAAYAAKLDEIRAKQVELINLADAEAVRRRTLAEELGGDLAKIEAEITANKKRILTEIQREYETHISALNSAARSHLAEVKRIEDEIAGLKLSTTDRLRSLQQQGMDEYQKYQDQQKQIAEKGAQAREALQEGEFQKAADLYEEQAALAERASNAVREGDKEIVTQQQAVATAVETVSAAMASKEQALQALADSHQARADEANIAIEQTTDSAKIAAHALAALSDSDTASEHTITTNADEALSEIDRLNGHDTSSTHTVTVREVDRRAHGGLIQRFANGGAVPGFPVPRWSTVPGSGNTDSVPASLEPG